MKIEKVQIFNYPEDEMFEESYSANIFVSDGFVLQIGTDGKFSIPFGRECSSTTEEAQDNANEEFCEDFIALSLGLSEGMSYQQLIDVTHSHGGYVE